VTAGCAAALVAWARPRLASVGGTPRTAASGLGRFGGSWLWEVNAAAGSSSSASSGVGGAGQQPADLQTFYVFRAQSDSKYPLENVNVGDMRGVLWYLHNEVVSMCPRKYGITRIMRWKLTVKKGEMINFVAFDHGACTVPNCAALWQQKGYRVGCQERGYAGLSGHWYSLPGKCPNSPVAEKTPGCGADFPGGACPSAAALSSGSGGCSYFAEPAGEVAIDALTGIHNYTQFCAERNLEYNRASDSGIGTSFWDGFENAERCAMRSERVAETFVMKYPTLPVDVGPPASCT